MLSRKLTIHVKLSTSAIPSFGLSTMCRTQITVPICFECRSRIMNAGGKILFFLGALIVLLAIPPTIAVENDDPQGPPAITLAANPAAISPSARGPIRRRVLVDGAVVVVPCATPLHHAAARVSNFVFRDCRSNLRSFSLLRC